ncbi:hypothetical protein ACFIPL_02450, partial [Escherichia coli]
KACVLPENPASYRVVRTKSYLFNKAISFSSRKTTKKSITILVHFFKQFLKTDSGYGAMGIFRTQCF